MKVRLVNRNGKSKKLSLIFSWGYFVFGPLYYMSYKLIWRFIFLTSLYVYGIWRGLGALLVDLLVSFGLKEDFVSFLKIPGEYYYITLGAIIGLHIVICFIAPRVIAKRLVRKKGYIPYSEIDAQLLVKYSISKVGTKCYLSNYKSIKGVQGKIKIENSAELDKKLNELAELLREGMITKDEYNTKRAEALMNVSTNK